MELDTRDKALLRALKADGRKSVTTLAAELDLSRATVQQRLDRLLKNGALKRFTIETDEAAGLDTIRAVMLIAVAGAETSKVTRNLRAKPEITELHSTNGAWDLVAMIEVFNLAEFDRVLRDVREIPGITSSETCLLLNRL